MWQHEWSALLMKCLIWLRLPLHVCKSQRGVACKVKASEKFLKCKKLLNFEVRTIQQSPDIYSIHNHQGATVHVHMFSNSLCNLVFLNTLRALRVVLWSKINGLERYVEPKAISVNLFTCTLAITPTERNHEVAGAQTVCAALGTFTHSNGDTEICFYTCSWFVAEFILYC